MCLKNLAYQGLAIERPYKINFPFSQARDPVLVGKNVPRPLMFDRHRVPGFGTKLAVHMVCISRRPSWPPGMIGETDLDWPVQQSMSGNANP